MEAAAIVLAAGAGTRMKSKKPKVAHEVLGKPLVRWVVDAAREAGVQRVVSVVGHAREQVEPLVADTQTVVQTEQNGTAGAVAVCKDALADFDGSLVVLSGDCPLITADTIARLAAVREENDAAVVVLTMQLDDPFGYGRIVRDEQGRKMSKSLGNGIDPLEIIKDYGADSLRFSLITGNSAGNDMRFYSKKVEAARNFCNKVYNAARFVLMNLGEEAPGEIDRTALDMADKWILHRLNTIAKEVTGNLDSFDLNLAAQKIYDFIWTEFCDWYIEMAKSRLSGEDAAAKANVRAILVHVLASSMKLLHPFMPFVTEEILERSIAAAKETGGCVAGVPAKDTIKVCDAEGLAIATPDRSTLRQIQTPQTFRRKEILAAYEKAKADGFLGTDDASVAEHSGFPVRVIMGSYRNIKITTKEDLLIGAAFLKEETE